MEYKITEGKNSNYEITLTIPQSELDKFKQKTLKHFQKEMDIKGFRKGHVPLDIVEQNVQPQYLQVGIFEEAIHTGVHKIMEENPEIKFIGNIYDLKQQEEKDKLVLSFKLDVYPEVQIANKKWESLKPEKIDPTPTDEELEQTMNNLKKQYAQYIDTDKIDKGTVFKIRMEYKDAQGNVLDKSGMMLGDEELEQYPDLKTMFYGRSKDDTFNIKYDNKIPQPISCSKKEIHPDNMDIQILDIKKIVLPEMNEENIQKFFPNENLKTTAQLEEKLKELIAQQKKQHLLVQSMEKYINTAQESLQVQIPNTLIQEEIKTRLKSLEQRLGGEEGMKKYLEQIGKENEQKLIQDVSNSAKTSLEKFFIFKKLTELLGLEDQIDWQKQLDAEQKVYDHLVGDSQTDDKPTKKTSKKSNKGSKKSK